MYFQTYPRSGSVISEEFKITSWPKTFYLLNKHITSTFPAALWGLCTKKRVYNLKKAAVGNKEPVCWACITLQTNWSSKRTHSIVWLYQTNQRHKISWAHNFVAISFSSCRKALLANYILTWRNSVRNFTAGLSCIKLQRAHFWVETRFHPNTRDPAYTQQKPYHSEYLVMGMN